MTKHLSDAVTRRRLLVCAVIGLLPLLIRCTLVTSKTDGQCFNDGECAARGPAFASTRCSATGTCELITLPEASADDAAGPCSTNKECNLRLNAKARCVTGVCQPLTNANCGAVDGDPTDENAVFVGVMTPRSGPNGAYGLNQYQVITTAAQEYNQAITGQTGTHPFVTIGCDELTDPAGTAAFLSTTVQVTTIFGPIYDQDFETAAPAASLNGTFLIGSRADDPLLSAVSGIAKNVWSFTPNRSIQAKYFQNLISTLEPSVRTTFSTPVGTDIKVAMVVTSDVSATNFAAAVEPTLMFNGKTIAANGSNYERVNVPFSTTTANDSAYSAAVVSLLTPPIPDLVILTQENELLNIVRAINSGWTGSKFPRFLLLTEDPAVESDAALAGEKFAGKTDFVTWTRSPQELTIAAAFGVDFRTAQGSDPATFSEPLYDSFYENAYALQSVLDTNNNETFSIDPGAYALAIAAFNGPGTPVNVGIGTATPNNVQQMLGLISAGTHADLDGASGPLTFSPTTGSPIQGASLGCIQAAGAVAQSGVTFDGTSGAATGTYSCL